MTNPVVSGAVSTDVSEIYDDGISELCNTLLAFLPRSDQRQLGELYVRGLLSVAGRKSIRNIASLTGSQAGEQRLHHFISKSTWDWRPIRASLTRYLHDAMQTMAWVIQPRIVEKSGEHSVGVRNAVVPCLGRTVNHQHVLAMWLVGPGMSCPVNWRLVLPQSWLADRQRRRKVGIPDHVDCVTPGDSAMSLVSDTVEVMGGLRQPLVMDARDADTAVMIPALVSRRVPFLLRLRGGTPVVAMDPAVSRYGGQPMPAQRLAALAKGLRRPVGSGVGSPLMHRLLVMPTLNRPGEAGPAFARPLSLISMWETAESASPQVWLTDLADVPLDRLRRLTELTRRVDEDFAAVSLNVGASDFEGRTYQGWHHHKTLVSLAHAIVELSSTRHLLSAPTEAAPVCPNSPAA